MKNLLIAGVLLVLSLPMAAENLGFIDMQRAFENYNETQTARVDFEKKQNELKAELELKEAELIQAKNDNKSEAEIQELYLEIQEELTPKQEELIQLNNQLMTKIRADILSATSKIAKDYGIDTVLDKQAILYGGFDLTDFVIDELNR